MGEVQSAGARRRAPLLYWRERRLSAFVFAATLLGGLALTSQGAPTDIFLIPILAAVLAALAADRIAIPLWHWRQPLSGGAALQGAFADRD